MRKLSLLAFYIFTVLALVVGASQLLDLRATAESATCCGTDNDCGDKESCQNALQGQTACCDVNQQGCAGAKYCRTKPELE